MAEFKPTREQQLSKNYDRHLSVKANAGSGKTKILIERYLDIIVDSYEPNRHKIHPSEITALTFTKKAAAEMLQRITLEVEKRISAADTTPSKENREYLEKYNTIRNQLTAARISTFHGFANSVLRDYPLEAGINPSFSDIDEVENDLLKKELMRDIIEEWLTGNDAKKKSELSQLIDIYSIKTIKSILNVLLASKEAFLKQIEVYKNSPSELMAIYDAYKWKSLSIKLKSAFTELLACVEKVPTSDRYDNFQEIQNQLYSAISNNENLTINQENIEPLSDKLKELLEFKCIQGKGTRINKLRPYLETNKLTSYESYSNFVEKHKQEDKKLTQTAIEHSTIFFNLAKNIFDTLDEEKTDRGVLDFDDMIILLRDLLVNNPDVAAKIRSKMKYLMVDEFQDTNQIQYDIVKALVPNLTDPSQKSPKLFIVGDGKQSIYGFRSADVRVFTQAISEIKLMQKDLANPDKIHLFHKNREIAPNDDELQGEITLNASFRMKPVLAAFVNDIFRETMIAPADEDSYHIGYEELVCGRKDKGIDYIAELEQNQNTFSDTGGIIDFVLYQGANTPDRNDEDEDEIGDSFEENAIAKHIRTLIDSPDTTVKSGEKLDYKHFAIISRSKTKFPQLGDTLSQYGIPFSFESGLGFFTTSEVKDIVAFLKFLYNTNDDLSFATILKSDYFQITDSTLFSIRNIDKHNSLWKNFRTFIKNAENPNTKEYIALKNAEGICELLYDYAMRLPIASLILQIENLTARDAKTRNLHKRDRINDNIEKFIDLARDFETDGYLGLPDFIRHIEYRTEISKEGEAISNTNDNTLKIMTMHAAKGLQFPVVIFHNPNNTYMKGGGNSPCQIDEKLGISFSVPMDNGEGLLIPQKPIHSTLTDAREKDKRYAEEIRLLYVLLTRAEERIIIPVGKKIDKDNNILLRRSSNTYISMIFDALGLDDDQLLSDENISRRSQITLLDDNGLPKEIDMIHYNISKYNYDNQMLDYSDLAVQSQTDKTRMMLMGNIYRPEKDYNFSATKIAIFGKNPHNFEKIYLLGLNSDSSDDKQEYMPNDNIGGKEVGILIHALLSEINQWYDFDKKAIKAEILKEHIELICRANNIKASDKKLQKRINSDINKIVSTDFINSPDFDFANSFAEHELRLPYYNDFLTAIIDLIIFNKKDNIFEIWDWKTNHIPNKAKFDELVENYKPQMQLYAYLASLKYPGQERYPARLIFTQEAKNDADINSWVHTFDWTIEDIQQNQIELKNTILEMKNAICMNLPPVSIEHLLDRDA